MLCVTKGIVDFSKAISAKTNKVFAFQLLCKTAIFRFIFSGNISISLQIGDDKTFIDTVQSSLESQIHDNAN